MQRTPTLTLTRRNDAKHRATPEATREFEPEFTRSKGERLGERRGGGREDHGVAPGEGHRDDGAGKVLTCAKPSSTLVTLILLFA